MKVYWQTLQFSNRCFFHLLALAIILGGLGACGQTEDLPSSEATNRKSQASQAILAAAGVGRADVSARSQESFQELSFLADGSSQRSPQPPDPNGGLTAALFDPSQVEVDDRIAGVTLAALDAKPLAENPDLYTGTARFEGRIVLEGIYHPPYEPGAESELGRLWNRGPCLQVAPESAALLPRLRGDFRAPWLCFDNPRQAVELLPDRAPRARVKVAIENYQIRHEIPDERLPFDAKGVRRARLAEVLEGGADKYCVQWRDFQSAVRLGKLAFPSPVPDLPEKYQTGCAIAEHGANALNIYVLPDGRIPETIPTPRSMQDWEIFKVIPFGVLRDRPRALAAGVLIVRYDSGSVAAQLAPEKAQSEPHIYNENTVLFKNLWLESRAISTEEMVEVLAASQDEWDNSNPSVAKAETFCDESPSASATLRSSESREIRLPERDLTFEVPANFRVSNEVSPVREGEAGSSIEFSIYDPALDDYRLCLVRSQVGTSDRFSQASLSIWPTDREDSWQMPCSPAEVREYNNQSAAAPKTSVDEGVLAREGTITFIDADPLDTLIKSCFYTPDRTAKVTVATYYLGEPDKPFDRGKIFDSSFYSDFISGIRFSESDLMPGRLQADS